MSEFRVQNEKKISKNLFKNLFNKNLFKNRRTVENTNLGYESLVDSRSLPKISTKNHEACHVLPGSKFTFSIRITKATCTGVVLRSRNTKIDQATEF